jgi:hypothetical protein
MKTIACGIKTIKCCPYFLIPCSTAMKKLIELYNRYKAYVRVDLVMYAVMILLIVLYFVYTVLSE